MDTFHAYHVAACDQGWENIPTVDSGMKLTTNSALWENILKAARKVGWDEKFQIEPHLFFLPDEDGFQTAFAWKQVDNGDLIVISPVSLSWLKTKALAYDNDYYGEFSEFDLDD